MDLAMLIASEAASLLAEKAIGVGYCLDEQSYKDSFPACAELGFRATNRVRRL